MKHWLTVMDGPFLRYGHSVSFKLLPIAKALGFTEIYSGHGGDEIVSYGTGRLNELAKEKKWLTLWREVKLLAKTYERNPYAFFYQYRLHFNIFRATSLEVFALCAEASDVTVHMPFFDRDLGEFCLSLSSDLKLRHGLTRYILREGMKNIMPESVRLRKDKFDFSSNFKNGLFADPGELLYWDIGSK